MLQISIIPNSQLLFKNIKGQILPGRVKSLIVFRENIENFLHRLRISFYNRVQKKS